MHDPSLLSTASVTTIVCSFLQAANSSARAPATAASPSVAVGGRSPLVEANGPRVIVREPSVQHEMLVPPTAHWKRCCRNIYWLYASPTDSWSNVQRAYLMLLLLLLSPGRPDAAMAAPTPFIVLAGGWPRRRRQAPAVARRDLRRQGAAAGEGHSHLRLPQRGVDAARPAGGDPRNGAADRRGASAGARGRGALLAAQRRA